MNTTRREAATVIEPVMVDDRGALVPDYTNATEHHESGWGIQPMAADEETARGRQAVVTRLKAMGPIDTKLDERGRVRYNGDLYEVEGTIRRWGSPTGHLAHVEAVLRRVEG